ncbi:UNVERIFIED_CONTAM: hypothetical protein NCL1_30635 [Trichonephila clavipes]
MKYPTTKLKLTEKEIFEKLHIETLTGCSPKQHEEAKDRPIEIASVAHSCVREFVNRKNSGAMSLRKGSGNI